MTWDLKHRPVFRIGGELSLSANDFLKPKLQQPDILRKKNHLHLDTGRSAIYVALVNIVRLGGKREAWLPGYCCPSVLVPFNALGFKLHFYFMGTNLDSPSGLPSRLNGQTFFFIHYFGKTNRAILNYLEQMKLQYRFFIIEDCVHALFNPNLGACDFAVYSYRKFLPQPDGALLLSKFPITTGSLAPADEAFFSRRLIAKLIRNSAEEELYLSMLKQAEETIDGLPCPRKMSLVSRFLLARTDGADIARRRRSNFQYLQDSLKQLAYDYELIHPLFTSLSPGEVPLGLPVVVDPAYRDKLRAFLSSKHIYCPVHWPLDTGELPVREGEARLSRSLLTLPIDQTLAEPELDYLLGQISRFFAPGAAPVNKRR